MTADLLGIWWMKEEKISLTLIHYYNLILTNNTIDILEILKKIHLLFEALKYYTEKIVKHIKYMAHHVWLPPRSYEGRVLLCRSARWLMGVERANKTV